jgi:hypothetical protein
MNGEYSMTPLQHTDTFRFGGKVINDGTGTITDVAVAISYSTTFKDTLKFSSILAGSADSSLSTLGFKPTAIGSYTFDYATDISETDGDLTNNDDANTFEITDTIFARDFGIASGGGAGFNGAANNAVGCKFLFQEADTITSISFYLATATPGESVMVHLYNFNNGPGSLIESSQPHVVVSATGWVTLALNCPAIVGAGEYFASVEQLGATNMGLGIYTESFFDSCVFYGPNANWLTIESIPFVRSPMIRLNVGPYDTYREVNISSNKDTVCKLSQAFLSADQGATFSWSPANLAISPTSQNTFFPLSEATEITVVADFGCGLSATDTITIEVTPTPTGTIIANSTICFGDSIDLTASGGNSYRWVGGPTDKPFRVSPSAERTYTVLIDSTNGCTNGYTTQVSVSSPAIAAFGDTVACIGSTVTIGSSGADSYSWDGGPTTADYSLVVSQTGYKVVTGANSDGCTIQDSVLITALTSPELTPLADTGACFTKFITITADAMADSFLWSNGDVTRATTFQMLAPRELSVIARNANGCESYDTLLVARYIKPNAEIAPNTDTAICEGTSISVTASGADSYEWSDGQMTATAILSPTELTTYTVISRSAEGCEDFDDITVSVNPLPVVGFSLRAFEDSVAFNNTSSLADSYAWTFGDGNTSTDLNPFNIYKDSGDYTITLTATNECGDSDSSITITVNVPKEINNVSDVALWKNINLYPNPTASALNYRIENQLYGNLELTILDVNGKILVTQSETKGTDEIAGSIDMTSYAEGMYFVEFKIGNSVIRSRVVKH